MTPEVKDDLDRQIDDVLTGFSAEEPRRVDAASVRRAMGARRAASLPAWFAVAAILILGLGVALVGRTPPETGPREAALSASTPVVSEPRATPSIETEPAIHTATEADVTRPPGRRRPRADTPAEPPYEGLPRLVVNAIDLPEPLSTGLLPGESIVIERIEIDPLAIPSLSDDHEPRP